MPEPATRTVVVWSPDWPVTAAVLAGDVADEAWGDAPGNKPGNAPGHDARGDQARGDDRIDLSAALPIALIAAGRVVACSAAARAAGVRRGLRRRETQSRCPDAVILSHDPDRDARLFEPVAAAIESAAPGIDVLRPGLVAVGARGPARYYGSDAAVARHLAAAASDAIRSLLGGTTADSIADSIGDSAGPMGAGVTVRAGVADGVLAATLAAQSGTGAGADPPVVPPGTSAAFLADRPVEALDRPELTDLLRRLGIRTLGAFVALPARDVIDRFGADGAAAHRLAGGLDIGPLAARLPAPETVVRTTFDPPVRRVDTAAFAARSLAITFHAGLTDRGLGCLRLGILARTTDGEELTRTWRHAGALSAAAVADRVRWQLDGWLTARRRSAPAGADPDGAHLGDDGDPDVGIAELALVPDQVVPYAGQQLGLWGGTGEADERADAALTRVQGMLGPTAVVTAVPDGGRDPGTRVHLVPWGDPREPVRIPPRGADDPRGAVAPWPGRLPPPSPATVLPAPVPVTVADDSGRPVGVTGRYVVTTPPAYLGTGGSTSGSTGGSIDRAGGRIVAWTGPWPVDERWWDPATASRRARFQVVTADGIGRLLALEGGVWWIEAVYD